MLNAHSSDPYRAGPQTGWDAAWLEVEHQAEHWDTPDHGDTGHLIAEALRAAALIGRAGGLRCEHRGGSASVPAAVLHLLDGSAARRPPPMPEAQQPPSAA